MIRKLKSLGIVLSMLFVAATPAVVVPSIAFATANIDSNLCSGTNFDLTGGSASCASGASTSNFNTLLAQIVNIFSAIVGVIAVIMIIVGGLRYITSGGDSSRVGAAKTTILYALVGLVVVALAQLIVHFVLGQAQTVTGGSSAG
ncbi:MAG: pilin [Candidatus Saccharimonadales bacterium]